MSWLNRKRDKGTVPERVGRGFEGLFGHSDGQKLVLVTSSGVEIPIASASGWGVLEVSRLIADIEQLPEITPGSRRVQ